MISNYAFPKLTLAIRPPLVAAALIALSVPSSPGQAGAVTTSAASTPANAPYVPTMTFDVASVRESKLDPNSPHLVGGMFQPHSTDLRLENVQLYYLITMAYGVDLHRVEGIPDWGWTAFNVQAKSGIEADERLAKLGADSVAMEQQHMLQALLADRFHLKVHWTAMEGKVYHLIVAKGGAKLLPTGSMVPDSDESKWLGDNTVPMLHQQGDGRRGYTFYGHGCGMDDLARILGGQMSTDVVNQTGIVGKFDFRLQYSGRTADDNRENDPTQWPPMIDAVQDQLGLKLVMSKGEVKMLLIDHVEKPSTNQ